MPDGAGGDCWCLSNKLCSVSATFLGKFTAACLHLIKFSNSPEAAYRNSLGSCVIFEGGPVPLAIRFEGSESQLSDNKWPREMTGKLSRSRGSVASIIGDRTSYVSTW